MVTARARALLTLSVAGAALLLSACGNATVDAGGAPTSAAPTVTAAPTATPSFQTPVPLPSTPSSVPTGTATKRPGPPGIPIPTGIGRAVTLDGVIEAGVEPGCKVLTTGSTMYLVLGGKDVPLGVPVRVEGVLQPGVLSTCQQGTPLRVTSVKRR